MAIIRSLALLSVFATVCGTALAADCSVNVHTAEMPSPQPLLLVAGTSQDFSSFLLPNLEGHVMVAQSQQITVACSGSSFAILEKEDGDHVTAECVGDPLFSVNNAMRVTLNGLACASPVTPSVRFTSVSCGARGRFSVVEVGFTVGTGFHRLYDVCFSNKSMSTAYAHHTIPTGIGGAQNASLSSDQVVWNDGSFFGKTDVDAAYLQQNETIGDLLNINNTDDMFADGRLERGALAPPQDFMLESQQMAAFFGINSAPRWTQLDSGNWRTLEDTLREKVSQRKKELEVYTGTYGFLALNNSESVPTAIYLSDASGSTKAISVPAYFWKIAYEPQTGLCAAFVTVNNPFATQQELETRYSLCENICSKIDWLQWEMSDATAGLSFCCDYEEFKKVVLGVPELNVKGYRENSSSVAAPAVWLTVALLLSVSFKSSFGGV